MKKIIIHWTAGAYQPNNTDYEHYQILINGDGLVIEGKHKPEDNENCNDGKYAQHCGGGNTWSIGFYLCCLACFKDAKNLGKYPMKKVQFEACMKKVAELCRDYKIPISPQTVMTHHEFGLKNPKTTSAGKIDIIHIPSYSWIAKSNVGDFIRSKVRWYSEHI